MLGPCWGPFRVPNSVKHFHCFCWSHVGSFFVSFLGPKSPFTTALSVFHKFSQGVIINTKPNKIRSRKIESNQINKNQINSSRVKLNQICTPNVPAFEYYRSFHLTLREDASHIMAMIRASRSNEKAVRAIRQRQPKLF